MKLKNKNVIFLLIMKIKLTRIAIFYQMEIYFNCKIKYSNLLKLFLIQALLVLIKINKGYE